jgi:hypothetical protein
MKPLWNSMMGMLKPNDRLQFDNNSIKTWNNVECKSCRQGSAPDFVAAGNSREVQFLLLGTKNY